eukprot:gene4148-5189_t
MNRKKSNLKSINNNSNNNTLTITDGEDKFNVIIEFGISDISEDIVNSIWRGDQLSDVEKETINIVSSRITIQHLNIFLSHLKSVGKSIEPLDIQECLNSYSAPNPSDLLKKKSRGKKKSTNKSKKKTTQSKRQSKKQQPKKKTGRRKKKDDSDEEMEFDDESEEEEDEDEEMDLEEDENESEEEEDENESIVIHQQQQQQTSRNQFLEFLERSGISSQGLAVLLYWLIDNSKSNEIRFCSASIYLYVIVLVRKTFHPFALRTILKFVTSRYNSKKTNPGQESNNGGDNSSQSINSKNKKSTKSSQRKKQSSKKEEEEEDDVEMDDVDQDDEEEDGEEDNQMESENKDPHVWAQKVFELLKDINWALDRFSMFGHSESFTHTSEAICQLSRSYNFPKPKINGRRQAEPKKDEMNIIEKAFTIISTLVGGRHGPLEHVLPIVLKEFIPVLSLNPGTPSLPATIHRGLIIDRDLVIEFIKSHIIPQAESHGFLLILLQHVCVRVPDRAEYRSQSVPSIVKILLSLNDYSDFISNFLFTFSRNSKSHYRQFSVEVSLSLLENEKIVPNDSSSSSDLIPKILNILVQRSSDKVATVRSKALSCLADLLENQERIKLINPHLKKVFNLQQDHPDSSKPSLIGFLSKRSEDEKIAVRKSSLQVLEVICLQNSASKPILDILVKRAQDISPLIRKQVINTLTLLLRTFKTDVNVLDAWRRSVVPLITDRESTVVEKCLESVNEIIFDSLIEAHMNPQNPNYIWKLLEDISIDMTAFLNQICVIMSKKKLITPKIIKALQSVIKKSNERGTQAQGGWSLLAEVGYCCPEKLDQQLCLGAWDRIKTSCDSAPQQVSNPAFIQTLTLARNILRVLESLALNLSHDFAKTLFADIYARVSRFSYDPSLVKHFISILAKLTTRIYKDQPEQINSAIGEWTNALLSICDEYLSSFAISGNSIIGNSTGPKKTNNEQVMGQCLFAIGELVQIPQVKIPSRLKTVVPALTASTLDNYTTSSGDGASQTQEQSVPVSVRAHAFITLGKMCLGDERIAKRCIATFAKELETSEFPIIRNNVMVVMCDLCTRYTQLVDNYIPNIAMCLGDPNELVREQTLILLTHLLQEDYIKWKGSLFFRYVEALVDPSPQISQLAQFCMMNVIQAKYGITGGSASANNNAAATNANGNIFYKFFLETIFVLNDCKGHPSFNQSNNNMVFSLGSMGTRSRNSRLKGEENQSRRMTIYSIFLQNMDDKHRFQLVLNICHDILGEIEEKLNLQECSQVISDALLILSSKDIKLHITGKHITDTEEEISAVEQAKILADGKFMSSVVKKNIIQTVLPTIIHLKHILQSKRSPLTGQLFHYLRELSKDYKNEYEEMLSADKQLAKELEFDLKNYVPSTNSAKNANNTPPITPGKTPSRLSIGGGISIRTPARLSITGTANKTPGGTDLSNFTVPTVKSTKIPTNTSGGDKQPPQSITKSSSTNQTPLKPFGPMGGRLSITPGKLQNNRPGGSESNNLFKSMIEGTVAGANSNPTPLKSAMRHSIATSTILNQQQTIRPKSKESSSSKVQADIILYKPETPPKPKKWNIKINNNNEEDDEDHEEETINNKNNNDPSFDESDFGSSDNDDDDQGESDSDFEPPVKKPTKKTLIASSTASTSTSNLHKNNKNKKIKTKHNYPLSDDDYEDDDDKMSTKSPLKKRGRK